MFTSAGSRRRPTIKKNKADLLNPEEGEDHMGDAVGRNMTIFCGPTDLTTGFMRNLFTIYHGRSNILKLNIHFS